MTPLFARPDKSAGRSIIKSKWLQAYVQSKVDEGHEVQLVLPELRIPADPDSLLGREKSVVAIVTNKGFYCVSVGRSGVYVEAARPYKKYMNALVLPGKNHDHESSESLARSMNVWIRNRDLIFAFDRSPDALQIFSYKRSEGTSQQEGSWLEVNGASPALQSLSRTLIDSIRTHEESLVRESEAHVADADSAWAAELVAGVLAGTNWIASWEQARLGRMRDPEFRILLHVGMSIIAAAENFEDLTDDELSQLAAWRPELYRTYVAHQESKVKATSAPPTEHLIRSPRDAEMVARNWMHYWGFTDAELTSEGADGGIDVFSNDAVAQVKAQMVPVGRPELQALFGIASVEQKTPLFFSLNGFTEPAIEWADRAGMALFVFDLAGQPEAVNAEARRYPCD